MNLLEALAEAGVDVSRTLERFSGNEGLYVRFLRKFLDDPNMAKLKEAMEAGALQDATTYAHTLKGVSGNLGMTDLFSHCEKLVADLRGGKTQGFEESMEQISSCYEKVIEVIGRF